MDLIATNMLAICQDELILSRGYVRLLFTIGLMLFGKMWGKKPSWNEYKFACIVESKKATYISFSF